jgi:hypothetical protein
MAGLLDRPFLFPIFFWNTAPISAMNGPVYFSAVSDRILGGLSYG